MADKRIIELDTKEAVAVDDYVALDGQTGGTKKFLASQLGGKAEVMTEAEWEDLPSDKYTDNKVYVLTDAEPPESQLFAKVGSASLDTSADNLSDAINEHESDISTLNSKLEYKAGDYFSDRSWKAMGRVINSGMGIFVTIYFGKPITATGATINIGNVNIYGITNNSYNSTISNVAISGNELSFILGTTASNPAGTLVLAEFNNTSITLT